MSFTQIAVTGTFKKEDGSAASGRVEFQLTQTLQDPASNEFRARVPIVAVLNGSGTISVSLAATNDPGITPTGARYTVTEKLTTAPQRSYDIEIPYNGGALDLADAPVLITPPVLYPQIGWYLIGLDTLAFATGGTERVRVTPSGLSVQDGSVAAPPLSFTSETDLGFYRIGAGLIGVADGGAETMRFAFGGSGYPVDVAAAEADGTAKTLARSDHAHAHGSGYLPDAHHAELHAHVLGDLPTTLATDAEVTSVVGVHAALPNAHHNQSHSASDHTGSVLPAAQQLLADGTVGAPIFSFTSDTNTGWYRIGADVLGVSAGGVEVARYTTVAGVPQMLLPDGVAGTPIFGFINDTNLGPWRLGADQAGWYGSFAIRGPRPYVDVRAFLTVGDGVADDGTPLANALAALPAAGGDLLMHAGDVYRTTQAFAPPSNCTIYAYGATIKCAIADLNTRTVTIAAKSNISIFGLKVDGDKGSFGVTEQKHGVYIVDSTDILLRDVTSNNNKGDGFYSGSSGGAAHSSRVTLDHCTADANHRVGLAIIDLTTGRFNSCRFVNSSGTSPQSGVDLEPNLDEQNVTDIVFTDCEFAGNVLHGVTMLMRAAPTGIQEGVRFVSCKSHTNGGNGWDLQQGAKVTLTDCDSRANTTFGVNFSGTFSDVLITGGYIQSNGNRGISGVMSGTAVLTNLKVVGTQILNNSATTPNTNDGVRLAGGSGFVTGATFIGVLFSNRGTSNQRYGITTGDAAVTSLQMVGCDLAGNASGASIFSDQLTTRQIWNCSGLVNTVVVAPAGTVSLPGQTFYNDPNTGRYWVAADDVADVVGGSEIARYTRAGGVNKIGWFGVAAVARPTSTAEIKAALASMGLLTDGGATPLDLDGGPLTAGWIITTGSLYFDQTRPKTIGPIQFTPFDILDISSLGLTGGWQGAIDLRVGYNAGTLRTGLRVIANADGATADVSVISKLTIGGITSHADGTVGAPGITFTGDLDTGFYHAADDIGVAVGGSLAFEVLRAAGVNKIGYFGVAPAARAAALTQTYATATRTHAADTAIDLATTAVTQTTPWGFATQAQGDAIATQVNALRVDVDNAKQVLNALIDDFQAYGLEQ